MGKEGVGGGEGRGLPTDSYEQKIANTCCNGQLLRNMSRHIAYMYCMSWGICHFNISTTLAGVGGVVGGGGVYCCIGGIHVPERETIHCQHKSQLACITPPPAHTHTHTFSICILPCYNIISIPPAIKFSHSL